MKHYVSIVTLVMVVYWQTVPLSAEAQSSQTAYVSRTQRIIDSLQRLTEPNYYWARITTSKQTVEAKQARLAAISCNNHLCGLVNGEVVSTQAGAWNDPATWSVRRVPINTDLVRLKHAVSVPVSFTAQASRLRYDASGRLLPLINSRLRLNP